MPGRYVNAIQISKITWLHWKIPSYC